jgi:hypothetical protein
MFLNNEKACFFTDIEKIPPYFTSKFFFDFLKNRDLKELKNILNEDIKKVIGLF